MSYSQQPLLDLLAQGQVPGETGTPTCVETVISRVYIFEKNVYKLYKNDCEFFNTNFHDLTEQEERHRFTKADFSWNNASSPAIYRELRGVRAIHGTIEFTDESPEELVIVMNRIHMADVLFEHLMRGEITAKTAYAIGQGLSKSLEGVRRQEPVKENYYEVFGRRIADSRAWGASVAEFIPQEEIDSYLSFLEQVREERRETLEVEHTDGEMYGGDIHCHNAILTNGSFMLMDTYSPKEEWLVEHWTVPAYRIAADLWSLTGDEELFRACMKGYEAGMGMERDQTLDAFYILYALGIAMPYHYMLSRTDESKREPAERMRAFMRSYLGRVSS